MSDTKTCGRCGAEMLEETAGGLCPRCLMALNFDSRTMPGDEAPAKAAPLSPEEMTARFPQFEILECLGRGGMGVVYKARQKSLNRPVALKLLAPERGHDARFAERFAREAELLAKLNHPHIVTIHDFGETGGLFYLVMEFVDGVNLRDLLRDGKLDPRQALAIVPPICEALQYAHDKGIVHRDIKPENLLLDRDGRLKIADFGIAKLVGAGGEVAGTPPYMAPEQAGNSSTVDHRADIYALGVVLYEMLTGERPAKELVAPSKKVRLDVRLDEIVLRALEKTPELRYQTAGEFRTVVETMAVAPAGALLRSHSMLSALSDPSDPSDRSAPAVRPVAAGPPAPANPLEPRKLVAVPAIGLMVASGLNLLLAGGVLLVMLLMPLQRALDVFAGMGPQRPLLVSMPLLALVLVGLPSLLTFIGARRMKRLHGYGLAVTAAILAIITPPGLLIGLVFGIWALVVLARRDVQDGFRQSSASSSGKGCLIAGLAAVVVIILLFLTLIGFRMLHVGGGHASTPTPAVFGPETVVTLPDPAVGVPCVLDFETGKLLVPPADIVPLLNHDLSQWPPTARRWLLDEGADAVLAPDGSLYLLEGVVFQPTRNGQAFTWDEFDPDFVITLANGLSEAERSAAPNQTEFHLVTTRQPAAVAFTTRERSRGIVQVLGASDSPRGVKIRYKMVGDGQMKQAAAAMPSPSPAFGPVIERVLPKPAAGVACVLDFETGKLLTPPDEIVRDLVRIRPRDHNRELTEVAVKWLRESGADAALEESAHEMVLYDAYNYGVSNKQGDLLGFDDFTPSDVLFAMADAVKRMKGEAINDRKPFHMIGSTEKAAAFITRERTLGVLQIHGQTEDGRGVKIRYKLLQSADFNKQPIHVEITGLVAQPGQHSLRRDATLLDALAAAGGWTGDGNLRAGISGSAGNPVSESTHHDLKAILEGRAVNPTVPEGARVTLSKINP